MMHFFHMIAVSNLKASLKVVKIVLNKAYLSVSYDITFKSVFNKEYYAYNLQNISSNLLPFVHVCITLYNFVALLPLVIVSLEKLALHVHTDFGDNDFYTRTFFTHSAR